jgi:Putative collagen-binding domain of a collagenase
VCSTTYCLVNPGHEYLVYQPNAGSFTVNIQSGTYAFEWFNPANGSVAGTGSIAASSGNRSFTPPFSGPAVLYLRK